MLQSSVRQHFLQVRKNISPIQKERESVSICLQIKNIFSKYSPKKIAMFSHTSLEPNLFPIFSSDYDFCFPKISDDTMIMKYVDSLEQLKAGEYGILEPLEECVVADPKDLDIILIPSVAIDINNNRIGMGKGYYDRYLAQCSNALRIGVIFRDQFSPEVFSTNSWDIPMHKVIFG